jgi:hypothetical protein
MKAISEQQRKEQDMAVIDQFENNAKELSVSSENVDLGEKLGSKGNARLPRST